MMKLTHIFILLLISIQSMAQHTFSIVAFDDKTGEVGGAGATCYPTVRDIADVHPGIGFIHTQSYVHSTNQNNAHQWMAAGLSPKQIMDSLVLHDAENDSTIRQYAAVSLSHKASAAFTGKNCFDYKGHRTGYGYAIAGNILLGDKVLEAMETAFLTTNGTLDQRLMAALSAAKIPGADKRCVEQKVSSLSAYIIVAEPTDKVGQYKLDLNVEQVLPLDPIAQLEALYAKWTSSKN